MVAFNYLKSYKFIVQMIFSKFNKFIFSFNTDNLKNGRFHHQLQTIFAPLVVRYVDLMESSIAQSIHKGFEKERFEIKGYDLLFFFDLLRLE